MGYTRKSLLPNRLPDKFLKLLNYKRNNVCDYCNLTFPDNLLNMVRYYDYKVCNSCDVLLFKLLYRRDHEWEEENVNGIK